MVKQKFSKNFFFLSSSDGIRALDLRVWRHEFYLHATAFGQELNRESLLKGRISTIDLLVLTSSNELLFIQMIFFLFDKQAFLKKGSSVAIP
jgi:hypothetical protein